MEHIEIVQLAAASPSLSGLVGCSTATPFGSCRRVECNPLDARLIFIRIIIALDFRHHLPRPLPTARAITPFFGINEWPAASILHIPYLSHLHRNIVSRHTSVTASPRLLDNHATTPTYWTISDPLAVIHKADDVDHIPDSTTHSSSPCLATLSTIYITVLTLILVSRTCFSIGLSPSPLKTLPLHSAPQSRWDTAVRGRGTVHTSHWLFFFTPTALVPCSWALWRHTMHSVI
jgi:hypothetical protein